MVEIPRHGQKHPQKAPKTNFFVELSKTPEGREQMKEWARTRKKSTGRPKGVPDGFRKHTIEPIREREKEYARKVVNIMADKMGVEDEYAKEALVTAVEVMRTPGETRERLSAARLVLDFTKQKPASKNELSIAKAEAFLESLIEEESVDAEGTSSGTEETA